MTAIKFLVNEGSYDYILSGSLLGACNVERRGRILYAPVYMVSCLQNA